MDILEIAETRLAREPEKAQTHGEDCPQWHDACLISRLSQEVSSLRAELRPKVLEELAEKTDVARRLRQTRANMIGTDDEDHYWDCHDASREIEHLRDVNQSLRDAILVIVALKWPNPDDATSGQA